ncbi:Mbeg1-like protein [Flavobacterium pedocola]
MKPTCLIKIIALLTIISINFQSCISYTKVPLSDCDHTSGWCKEIRDIAVKSWKYAQLSKNVYNKTFQFKTDKYFEKIENFENESINFFAVLYKEKQENQYVLVFRGTDSFNDFKTGNNPFKQEQNKYALKIYDLIKRRYNFQNCIVAGHSLGGGIAIHVSLNRENITAFTFNGSPVFKNKNNISNERYSIVENGEVLKIARILGREADQLYTSIDCSSGNTIKQHDMKNLAICLTQIAAVENKEATESLILNGIIKN